MSMSPGHCKWPNHKVEERRIDHPVQISIGRDVIADSSEVLKLEEDNHPDRYYFPRADVRMEALERTTTQSSCPFKGTASYFTVAAGGQRHNDAAWSYEAPYDEHARLKGRVAFDTDTVPELEIRG